MDWDYAPIMYWPEVTDSVSFYSYSPAGSVNVSTVSSKMNMENDTLDNAVIEYTVPTSSAVLKLPEDFLVAKQRQAAIDNTTVVLNFRHALAMATFSSRNASKEINYVIDGIELLHLHNTGKLDLIDVADTADVYWKEQDGDVTYAASIPEAGIALQPLGNDAQYQSLTSPTENVPILPQSVTANTIGDGSTPAIKVYFHAYTAYQTIARKGAYKIFPYPAMFEAGVTGGEPTYPMTSGDFVFQMGHLYQFQLDFDNNAEIKFYVKDVAAYDTTSTVPPTRIWLSAPSFRMLTTEAVNDSTATIVNTNNKDGWSATTDADWITLGVATRAGTSNYVRGLSGQALTVTAGENTTDAKRRAEVIIKSDTVEVKFAVSQVTSPFLIEMEGIDTIYVQHDDQEPDSSWYGYSNTPYGVNEFAEPPYGAHSGFTIAPSAGGDSYTTSVQFSKATQSVPVQPNSCAEIPTDDPDKPWRLPTISELSRLHSWTYNGQSYNSKLDPYNFDKNTLTQYWSSDPRNYAPYNEAYPYNPHSSNFYTSSISKTNTSRAARCFRDK
jgi:hypothetical protein